MYISNQIGNDDDVEALDNRCYHTEARKYEMVTTSVFQGNGSLFFQLENNIKMRNGPNPQVCFLLLFVLYWSWAQVAGALDRAGCALRRPLGR